MRAAFHFNPNLFGGVYGWPITEILFRALQLSATPETCVAELVAVPLLIIDDLEMHKLPHTAEDGHRVRGTLTRAGVVRLTPRNCTLASV